MYIKDQVITLEWVLSVTDNVYAESHFDLEIQSPDKTITYDDSGTWSTTYTAATSTTEGSLTLTWTPTQVGAYTIRLLTGTPASHAILHKKVLVITDTDLTSTSHVTLA